MDVTAWIFLTEIQSYDEIAAVRVAWKWIHNNDTDKKIAGLELCRTQTTVKFCNGCNEPIWDADDAYNRHYYCDPQQEVQDILDDFCGHYGCWEPRTPYGYDDMCEKHTPKCPHCGDYRHPGACDPEDFCDGCGNPHPGCVCAELASLARHNADPATRGSWWTA